MANGTKQRPRSGPRQEPARSGPEDLPRHIEGRAGVLSNPELADRFTGVAPLSGQAYQSQLDVILEGYRRDRESDAYSDQG